jgi:membrane-bound serine protease (ClpP class)
MVDWLGIVSLYAVGIILIISELFLPAHGLIGLLGLGVVSYGIYLTHGHSETTAMVAFIVVIVVLPIGLIVSVKNWHRTPVGRRVSPPNPTLTAADRMPVDHMNQYIGRTGRTISPLRPVGMCEFDGKRIECTAEFGMIERGVRVEGVRVVDRTLSVQAIEDRNA